MSEGVKVTIFWNAQVPIYYDFPEDQQTLASHHYSKIWEYDVKPASRSRHRVLIFKHQNVRTHTAQPTRENWILRSRCVSRIVQAMLRRSFPCLDYSRIPYVEKTLPTTGKLRKLCKSGFGTIRKNSLSSEIGSYTKDGTSLLMLGWLFWKIIIRIQ